MSGIFTFCMLLLSPFLFSIFLVILSFFCFHLYHYYFKKMRLKGKFIKPKKISIFRRIFLLFPQRLSLDIYNRDPNSFNEYGLHMFCGEQGSGKTTALVELLLRMKETYPMVKVKTNMHYKYEDGSINHWKDIINCDNGIYGEINVLDEIQTWFNSNESKNFPPEMLTEVSQQRKQRKMLVGSAQLFSRIAKPIREQTTFVYMPVTFCGCLTFVRVSKPQFWDEEKQKFTRFIKTYFFVHNDEIRDAFDTYKKIESYKKVGFTSNKDNVIRNSFL